MVAVAAIGSGFSDYLSAHSRANWTPLQLTYQRGNKIQHRYADFEDFASEDKSLVFRQAPVALGTETGY